MCMFRVNLDLSGDDTGAVILPSIVYPVWHECTIDGFKTLQRIISCEKCNHSPWVRRLWSKVETSIFGALITISYEENALQKSQSITEVFHLSSCDKMWRVSVLNLDSKNERPLSFRSGAGSCQCGQNCLAELQGAMEEQSTWWECHISII